MSPVLADISTEELVVALDLSNSVIKTRSGKILYWSSGSQELFGWESKDAVGRFSHDLLQATFADSLQSIHNSLNSSGCWVGEVLYRTKEKGILNVLSRWTLTRGLSKYPRVVEVNAVANCLQPQLAFLVHSENHGLGGATPRADHQWDGRAGVTQAIDTLSRAIQNSEVHILVGCPLPQIGMYTSHLIQLIFEAIIGAIIKVTCAGEVTREAGIPALVYEIVDRVTAAFPGASDTRSFQTQEEKMVFDERSIDSLKKEFNIFSATQREALHRFYMEGETASDICDDLKFLPERFDFARRVFRSIVQLEIDFGIARRPTKSLYASARPIAL